MSIFSTLSFDTPIIAYSAFHQAKKNVPSEAYVSTMLDLHKLLREQTSNIQSNWESHLSARITHSLSTIRRLLTPFLTTPLKSDEIEIEKGLRDELQRLVDDLLPRIKYGVIATTEGRITLDAELPKLPKKFVSNGRMYLKELSMTVGKGVPDVFESNFIIHGSENLDIIEHLVRDRIGIYTPVHGKHIKEFEGYSYAAHNLILLHGELSTRGVSHEAALFFSKGETHYAPFRNGVAKVIEPLKSLVPHVSVWQRKLGLGTGREFILRVRYSDKEAASEMLERLLSEKAIPFVHEAFSKSYLLIKELLS
ncbi:MAG TPA: hypothetical protein VNN76_05415 [Bacteroidota bacterium]|nr:hypothetical protein [Bacteroidota bacterium]